jgi:putative ABC transport system permease protein
MGWLSRLFHRPKLDAQLDSELRFHVEQQTADNIAAGMNAGEARRQALIQFGGLEYIKEETRDARGTHFVESLVQDLRFGLRMLRKSPGFAAVAILTLALGIGANTAIFSVVNAVLLRALPYTEPDRIAVLWATDTLNGSLENNTSVANFEDLKKRARTFEDLASYRESDSSFTVNGEPDWIEYAFVYGDFFGLLGRSPALGRVFSGDDNDPHQVVLSDGLWRNRFGASRDVIGRTVTLSGIDFQVIGVMSEDFAFPSKQTQLWTAAAALPNWPSRRAQRGSGFGPVLARLRPGATLGQAQEEMEQINRQLTAEYPTENEYRGIRVVPLAAQIHGKTVPFMLAVLSAAIFLVLLIACANAANLLLARGAVRRREIALRVALGAGRRRILRQLVTESILLSGFAGALGLPFAAWSIHGLVALAPPGVARLDEAHIDTRVLAFTVGLSLVTGLLFGLAPALRISGDVSRRQETAGSRGLRRAFVVAELALALMLLAGAGLLIRSFVALEAVDLNDWERLEEGGRTQGGFWGFTLEPMPNGQCRL